MRQGIATTAAAGAATTAITAERSSLSWLPTNAVVVTIVCFSRGCAPASYIPHACSDCTGMFDVVLDVGEVRLLSCCCLGQNDRAAHMSGPA